MPHILKVSNWETASGFVVADTNDLGHDSAVWWHIPRMLNMSLVDYIKMLKDEYQVVDFKYIPASNHLLLFFFPTQAAAHKFELFVNREAKKRKYFIG